MTTLTQDELQALLPFWANGTLEGEERDAVETALAQDAGLRADLAALQAIRDTMQAEEVRSPGEFGLARLMREVEAERPSQAPVAANDNAVPRARLRLWQAAAVAALAIGVGINMPQLGTDAPEMAQAPEAADAGFTLASGGDAPLFTITFAPEASEAEMRALLLDAGVEIVEGPSALGLYGLSLLDIGQEAEAREILAASDIVEDLQ